MNSAEDYGQASKDFKSKYCDIYKCNSFQNDISQPFWQSINLQKKRLENFGLTKEIQIHENGNLCINDPNIIREIKSYSDNSINTTLVETPISTQTKYFVNGKKISKTKDYYSGSQCIILEGDENPPEYVCPNCGAIGTKESYIDGCDYCGSKFEVNEFNKKINAYNIYHDYNLEIKHRKSQNRILLIVLLLIALFLSFISMSTMFSSEVLAAEVMLQRFAYVLILIVICFAINIKLSERKLIRENKPRIIRSDALQELKDKFSDFNMEVFSSKLDYKIKTIHFANTINDVELFLNRKYENVIEKYNQVTECNLKNCRIDKFCSDNEYTYIDVTAGVHVVSYEHKKIVTREEEIYLTLYTQNTHLPSKSIISYSCPHCGNSINLLSGGTCDHCGQKLDLTKYDWAISKYSSSWDTNPKSNKKNAEKRMWKNIIVTSCIIVFINIPLLISGCFAGIASLKKDNYSVYSFQTEFIPSFSYYGYSMMGNKTSFLFGDSVYEYTVVNDFNNDIMNYSGKLINDDGFEITYNDESRVVLERNKKYGLGKLKVTITKQNKKYTIRIGD